MFICIRMKRNIAIDSMARWKLLNFIRQLQQFQHASYSPNKHHKRLFPLDLAYGTHLIFTFVIHHHLVHLHQCVYKPP